MLMGYMDLDLLLNQLLCLGSVDIMTRAQRNAATEQSIGRDQGYGPKEFTPGSESKYKKMQQRSCGTTFLPSLLSPNLRKTLHPI